MVEHVANQGVLTAVLWPIAVLPLIGSAATFLIGRKNHHIAGWIATLASALSFAWVLKTVLSLTDSVYFEDKLFNWFSVGGLTVDFGFRFDHLTAVMCLIVTGIGSLIHLYSVAYMHEDHSVHRFFSYLNLFMFSMLLLVLGSNLLVLFVGWEGVGLCSYLLIGFWYKDLANARAGRKAFVVNRIGDAGFLLGMFLIFGFFKTLDFQEILQQIAGMGTLSEYIPIFTAITLCLFVGACGKSAQIPLFTWLPDAMAGPTPVSALIHAATMVTAGVYMMARLSGLFINAPVTMMVVATVAVLTALVAAITAITQNDIKKVLAYSTVSQLGFMFMGAGSGAFIAAVFHLVTHAFFKACLFLGAGSVIHGCHHEQDMRHMGGLKDKMPITFATYFVSVLAIAGIAPFSGYYSKHMILAALDANKFVAYAHVLSVAASFAAFLTAFYMTRSLCMTFFGSYRGHAHPHESPWHMTVPLIVLAVLAATFGIFYEHHFVEYLSLSVPLNQHLHEENLIMSVANSWIGFLGVGLALFMYTQMPRLIQQMYEVFPAFTKISLNKFYFDEIYNFILVRPLEWTAHSLWKGFDQAVIDGTVNRVGQITESSGELVRKGQTGYLGNYAFFTFLGAVIVLLLIFKV